MLSSVTPTMTSPNTVNSPASSPASATHPDYREYAKRWQLVRDVINSRVKKYLRDVDPSDVKRVEVYRDMAMFTNFTGRTKVGLVGAVFRKDLQVVLPEAIAYLEDDSTGTNISLTKLAQEITGEVLQAGRYGLLVDFPRDDDDDDYVTIQKNEAKNERARICKYTAESIINWNNEIISGNPTLMMVVLKEECNELTDDGFSWIKTNYFRVLRLVDGIYHQLVYDDIHEEPLYDIIPLDYSGQPWDFIPFIFVGSEDNDSDVDPSPLFDLAMLNIGHYRNSADLEESLFIAGQITIFVSTEMDAASFKDANPRGILLGSRSGHNLGPGGKAEFLQASPNQVLDKAMERKEEQAVMVGARLIVSYAKQETAEAARMRQSGENSVLAAIVQNVQDAIITALEYALKFMGDESQADKIEVTVNDQFFDPTLNPQMIIAQMQLVNAGIIAKADLRTLLRKFGALDEDRTDEIIQDEIDQDAAMGNPMGTAPGAVPGTGNPPPPLPTTGKQPPQKNGQKAPTSNPTYAPSSDANPNPLVTPILP